MNFILGFPGLEKYEFIWEVVNTVLLRIYRFDHNLNVT